MQLKKQIFVIFTLALLLQLKAFSQSMLYPNEFDLSQITLLDGPFLKAMNINDSVLLEYDADRLLQPYQKQAGITQTGKPFINWSGEIGSGLDGHVGGHYLSALAMHFAATRDVVKKEKLKNKFDYVLAQLKLCQDAVKDSTDLMYGYLGGVPGSRLVWTNIYNLNFSYYNSSWVPFYNLHKTYSGLRDAWLYTGNSQARIMFLKLCDWGIRITSKLSDSQLQTLLNTEHGGMNEVYADAYQMTGNTKYLTAARRFSHQVVLTNMKANSTTYLDGKHANTQIPKVIGFERIFNLDKSQNDYHTASVNFWKNVVTNRSLALGGNSVNEHFLSAANSSKYTTEREGPESCNTYNMLKLTEDLFTTSPNAEYADYYEKALFNHILSTQHPEHGGYVYFTPARPQHYRVYSQVNQAMWCCVGSGMENHGKYGQFIYTHKGNDSLYVNLFIASHLDWNQRGIQITQETKFPYEQSSKFSIRIGKSANRDFSLFLRHPKWVDKSGFVIKINNEVYSSASSEQTYVEIKRTWNDNDIVTVSLPMKTGIEVMPGYNSYVAITYGPILLGAKTGNDKLTGLIAGEGRMEHVATGPLNSLTSAPILIGDRNALADSVKILNKDSLLFKINGYYNNSRFESLVLQPFYSIHDARYMMYWWQLTPAQYQSIKAEVEAEEAKLMELDNRTIDFISPGAQQSESDHFMKTDNSQTGIFNNESYRQATDGGWFEYNLLTKGKTDSVSLMIRYFGNETGNRTFDILIDSDTLTSVNISNKWKINSFLNVEYKIPSEMLIGKDTIRVRLDAKAGNIAGGVFYIRLLGPHIIKYNFYKFTAAEWGVCDAGRAAAANFSYDYTNNNFTIKKSGNNNICFMHNLTQSDKYFISNDKTWFLIKGKNLKTAVGSSYIWWFNGFNNGGSTAPDITFTDNNSEVFLLWNITSKAALSTNMDYSQPLIKLSKNGNNFINAIGLTSSATDYSSTINEIDFYSVEELVSKYPQLGPKFGITSVENQFYKSDEIEIFTENNRFISISSVNDRIVLISDLNGKVVKRIKLISNQPKTLSLKPGVYFINGKKFVIGN